MIEKARLSIEDLRVIPVGATMSWLLESGAAVISAKNTVIYCQRHDGMKFTTRTDFSRNYFEVTRIY